MKKTLGLLTIAPLLALGAVERDICIALDGSGSMGSANFSIQINATADQIEDSSVVPTDGTIAFTIVQFGSVSTVEVSRTIIDSPATATTLANDIRNITYEGGSTAMHLAIADCASELDVADTLSKQIIDLSTDGVPNDLTATRAAADAAMTAGVDAINAIGTGSGVNQATLEQIVRPQPSSTIPDDGFVVIAPDFSTYTTAIQDKMNAEVNDIAPAPATVAVPLFGPFGALLLSALMGFFGYRRLKA